MTFEIVWGFGILEAMLTALPLLKMDTPKKLFEKVLQTLNFFSEKILNSSYFYFFRSWNIRRLHRRV